MAIALLLPAAPIFAAETILPLWTTAAPGSEGVNAPEVVVQRGKTVSDRSISHIHNPTLTVHLPAKAKATGTAVVICPGGGYNRVVIDKEGNDVARWLASIGVAGFVLKFRNPRLPEKIYGPDAPIADACRAMRLVRSKATEFGLDPRRIGLMGFSAGGHLASTVATHWDDGNPHATDAIDRVSCRPDFLMLIYPMISLDETITDRGSKRNLLGESPGVSLVQKLSNEFHVDARTPPTFLVQTGDDSTSPENSVRFYLALRRAGVPAELHLYERGGHGYGIRPSALPNSAWPARCEDWLRGRGWLTK